MASNLAGVITSDDISAWLCESYGIWGHLKDQVLPVVSTLLPCHASVFKDDIVPVHT